MKNGVKLKGKYCPYWGGISLNDSNKWIDDARYLLNGSADGMAATLKCSNHREMNITFPEGGARRNGSDGI